MIKVSRAMSSWGGGRKKEKEAAGLVNFYENII